MSSETLKLNAQLCKHAYNEANERVARLASYATSRSLKNIGFGEYYSLSEELAKKDIIILCISVRRLAEMTKSSKILKNLNIDVANLKSPGDVDKSHENCWNIIGNILHGVQIDILKEVPTTLSADFFDMIKTQQEIDAMFCIKSEKFTEKAFSAIHFLKAVNTYVEKAEEILSDNRIFVGSLYD